MGGQWPKKNRSGLPFFPSRFNNRGEGIFGDVFDLKIACSAVCTSESSSANEKFPRSMQTRRSRVFGQFWLVLAAVWGWGWGYRVRVRGWVGSSHLP